MANPEDILSFWLDEIGPKGWYEGTDDLDALVVERFGDAWREATRGAVGGSAPGGLRRVPP